MPDVRVAAAVSAGLAAVVGVAAWVIGVSLVQSAFLAAGVMTASAGYTVFLLHDVVHSDGRWPERSTPEPEGTRRDLRALSPVGGRRSAVSEASARRLRALAEHRLARHGIDLDHPRHAAAAERLLGSRAYRVVMADSARPVRYAAFERCVAAVEHLDDLRIPAPVAATPSNRQQRR